MAADNDSQGLKVAVAAFITITVILGVTSYFLYSSVANAQAQLDSAREAQQLARRAADVALSHYDEMRTRIGTKAQECDAAKQEISANFKKIEQRIDNLMSAVNAAVHTAEQNGARLQDLEDVKVNVQRAIASYRSEPNRTYISSLERLTEATENLALLTTQLSLKYAAMKKSPDAATRGAKGQKDQGPTTKD